MDGGFCGLPSERQSEHSKKLPIHTCSGSSRTHYTAPTTDCHGVEDDAMLLCLAHCYKPPILQVDPNTLNDTYGSHCIEATVTISESIYVGSTSVPPGHSFTSRRYRVLHCKWPLTVFCTVSGHFGGHRSQPHIKDTHQNAQLYNYHYT